MIDAIVWRWPGARLVVRGGVLERWDGPMPRPSDAEIAQAVADYAAQGIRDTEVRERELGLQALEALAIATYKLVQAAVPGLTVTPAQFRQAIRVEWDALR